MPFGGDYDDGISVSGPQDSAGKDSTNTASRGISRSFKRNKNGEEAKVTLRNVRRDTLEKETVEENNSWIENYNRDKFDLGIYQYLQTIY